MNELLHPTGNTWPGTGADAAAKGGGHGRPRCPATAIRRYGGSTCGYLTVTDSPHVGAEYPRGLDVWAPQTSTVVAWPRREPALAPTRWQGAPLGWVASGS